MNVKHTIDKIPVTKLAIANPFPLETFTSITLPPYKFIFLKIVKINSNTLDFTLLNENSKFIDELKETDSIITNNYKDIDKNVFYDNETIAKDFLS